MSLLTFREALRNALIEEMDRDPTVLLMGEEVAEYQGAYKVSQGLLEKYGPKRIIDTPITEAAFTGIAIGAAMAGLHPIVEWMTFNFGILALDQVINNAAKMRYMSGGQTSIPIVIRGPNGPAEFLGSQHSQNLASILTHIPGLKVICPATPYDAKGLLKTAIRDGNPVMFMESELMYQLQGEVPDKEYLIPFGKADIKRAGQDVTLLAYGRELHTALAAAEQLATQGIDAEVIDLRSLRPLDSETIFASVAKTNHLVIVDESWPIASLGSYIAHLVAHDCFDLLDAPIELVQMEDVPMPYNHALELAVLPSMDKIITAVQLSLSSTQQA